MKQSIKHVVLVHGAFADGSGWEAVSNILKKDGYTVAVVQHPETSYAEDVKFTKAVIDRQSGPVVLVGHSYGGAVITEAGNHPKVAALVYIAAFALDTGESCATIEQALPPATTGIKPTDDGYFYIDPAVFHADFAADLPEAKAAFMAESQVLISADSFTSPVKTPAWKSKPTWYMVATADRSINPDQERMMAKRANAKTIEVNSSHVAYMSHPKETAKLIEEAATSLIEKVATSAPRLGGTCLLVGCIPTKALLHTADVWEHFLHPEDDGIQCDNPVLDYPKVVDRKDRMDERFRRIDVGHMDIRVTFTDPKAYPRPITFTQLHDLLPDTDLLEFFCADNERDPPHLVTP